MDLQRQCAKLQELKAKSVVANEEARRREIEREKLLVAQPAAAETDGASSPMWFKSKQTVVSIGIIILNFPQFNSSQLAE